MSHYTNNYEFGPYQFDLNRRVLMRAGQAIPLTPKATEILVMLLANAGQLVEKDELLKEVWPDTFVEESNLTQNIFTLRKALGDDRADPRYIETVTRRGYRFVAQVRFNRVIENQLPKWQRGLAPSLGSSLDEQPIIAVLPFVNADKNKDLENFASVLTDDIINNLSRVPSVHVMSRSAILRYKTEVVDPQQAGKDLGAHAVLIGKINGNPSAISIDVELVDVWRGWQLWGERFEPESNDLLEIQNEITRWLVPTLKLKLTRGEEKSVIARFTENSEAYHSYIEGRHYSSDDTQKGNEEAIKHFERAIEIDPHYALAYGGIIDCYLRLATNYLPSEGSVSSTVRQNDPNESHPKVRLRFEWDWKSAERELRHANDLQANYPSSHQWYAAYRTIQQLFRNTDLVQRSDSKSTNDASFELKNRAFGQIASLELTSNEQVQVYCVISREQIDVGNYEAAARILGRWWSFGKWPVLEGLDQKWCADLLFTCGELAGCVASTLQIRQGQRHGEELLNGSIALFEQLGFKRQAAEARIGLALCYYRQGLFDIGRATLIRVLDELSVDDSELRSLALIRLGILERHAGRLRDALARLTEASTVMERAGPWASCRCHIEMASTYKDLAIAENASSYFDAARDFYIRALHEFAAIGNHRYVGIAENNLGFLMLSIGAYEESETHLLRSRTLFEDFHDRVRAAQVNETLARLYIAMDQYALAQETIRLAIEALELTDGEALLAEALTTSGIVNSKLNNSAEAKRDFEAAYRIAERCGDREGAGRAMLVMVEEIGHWLSDAEKIQVSTHLKGLLSVTQQTALRIRVERSLALIGS